jgi:hypothetical protein
MILVQPGAQTIQQSISIQFPITMFVPLSYILEILPFTDRFEGKC